MKSRKKISEEEKAAKKRIAEEKKDKKKKETEKKKGLKLTERVKKLEKAIETIQTKDLQLTIERLGDLVIVRAQDSKKLLAGLHDLLVDHSVIFMSVNGNSYAFLRKIKK